MNSMLERKLRSKVSRAGVSVDHGFTLIELLVGMTVMTFGLLGVAAMFPMAYFVVNDAGKMTMALTGTRQILEDIRSVPFVNLANLNGFDTTNSVTIPASEPERGIARRWRYALAGEGGGFTYTTTEKAQWTNLSTSNSNAVSSTTMTAPFGAGERSPSSTRHRPCAW